MPQVFQMSVENIPQVHFAGAKDKIVPSIITESYRAKFTDATMFEIRTDLILTTCAVGKTHSLGEVSLSKHS